MQSPVPSAWGCPAVFTLWFPGPWLANCRVSSMDIIPNYYLFVNIYIKFIMIKIEKIFAKSIDKKKIKCYYKDVPKSGTERRKKK